MSDSWIVFYGAMAFGMVNGCVVYRTLWRPGGTSPLAAGVAGLLLLGGAAVLALFEQTVIFGSYALGLAGGFFSSFAVGVMLLGGLTKRNWHGGD